MDAARPRHETPPPLPQELVFVDLETTGGNAGFHRITEVGIVRVSNGEVIDEWSTLVNPECRIPAYIESFTGITNEMVADAPTFARVAARVMEKLSDAVFVAHNARFDYAFLRTELRRCGLAFAAKVLCTVKLSRRLYPEFPRHNLDVVMQRHGLTCSARHRALGDARVIADFWRKLLRDLSQERLAAAATAVIGANRLPAYLPAELADELPEGPGVYRFFGEDDVLLYIGKSQSLRTRILGHFAAEHSDGQEQKKARLTRRIDWVETAGDLGAQLKEAEWIKAQKPLFNKRLKTPTDAYTLELADTDAGVALRSLDTVDGAHLDRCYGTFHSAKDARKALGEIARAAGLCLKTLGLEEAAGSCFAYQIGKCRGVCIGKESLLLHRTRLVMALSALKLKAWPFPGRIALKEGPAEHHVLDRWAYVGTAHDEDELATLATRAAPAVFDADVYRSWRASHAPAGARMVGPPRQANVSDSTADNVRYWIATAPVGAAAVLAEELAGFGASDIRERSHDVKFQGTLEVGYRACLWSRTATRVLLSLGSVDASSREALFEALRRIDWRDHLAPHATLACDSSGGNESIRHTIYGSQLLKDAVCDGLRDTTGERPNIKPERPDVLLHLHIEGPTALVSVDFSGESLHRRGYRVEGGRAPLKENVAAAVLLRAGWPAVNDAGGSLVDPLCGSGTFLVEAALLAADAAPALGREYFGFQGWRGHDPALWERLCAEARARRSATVARRCIVGSDADPDAVRMAIENAQHAGVADWVHIEKRDLGDVQRPAGAPGLVVTNPPYGERIGAEAGLTALYAQLGRVLRERFMGWRAAVLTGNPPLARNLGVYAKRTHRFNNGTIECRLLRFDLDGASEQRPAEAVRADWAARPGAQMFANRLRKNLKSLDTWAEREAVECFRVYDADMPEYAFAIDLYGRDGRHAYVQEYAPPKTVNQESARERRREVLAVLPQVLGIPVEHIHSRLRKAQKGGGQYEKRDSLAERHVVREAGLKFWVNFRDYLDTGLFLDHRIVRQNLRESAKDKDFLNLFCYTGSATVYAAAGGARSTTSVDLSNTYLEWAHENLLLNGLGAPDHEFVRADCLQWLDSQAAWGTRFDLIFLDPPTFSNSKRMDGVLDVQRDHVGMIRRSLKLLRPTGQLVFSTNHSRFELDAAALSDLDVDDISAATIPKDFARHARIHRCFVVRLKADRAA